MKGIIKMKQQVAEQEINDKLLKKIAPDVISENGQKELMAKRMAAHHMQGMLDRALAMASNAIGGTFSTRVKDSDVATKKIAQKRLQGRDYGIKNLNDMLGGRLVVNSPKDFDKAEEQINEMAKQGIFTIKKKEHIKTGNYDARHFDVKLPNGLTGEVQVHTKHSEAESMANHQIRAEFGEKPEGIVKALRDKQADIIDDMHPDHAKALSHAISLLQKQDGVPPDHVTIAKLIKQAS